MSVGVGVGMGVGVVGAGVIGTRRALVVDNDPNAELLAVADVQLERAMAVVERCIPSSCGVTTDWQQVINNPAIQVVIVSTVNKFLAPITIAALEAGKHVLCEKPLGRNLAEAQEMVTAARRAGRVIKTGFNHRHHPAVAKGHTLVREGKIGNLMSACCIYGHGGRPGYEREWRADFDLAGGGELLDQGVHVLDLLRWFLGDFTMVVGQTATHFWDLGAIPEESAGPQHEAGSRVEDNAWAMLRTAEGQVATLHTSWTQWKNCFLLEVFGTEGYVRVDGLGGSYGPERLVWGRRRPESGPPVETAWEFNGPDLSWEAEWGEFTAALREQRRPLGDGQDGLATMQLVDAIYRSASTGRCVSMNP